MGRSGAPESFLVPPSSLLHCPESMTRMEMEMETGHCQRVVLELKIMALALLAPAALPIALSRDFPNLHRPPTCPVVHCHRIRS